MPRLIIKLGLPLIVSVLTACGGGAETADALTPTQIPSGALNLDKQSPDIKGPQIKASDSDAAEKKSAEWIHLDSASDGKSKPSVLRDGIRQLKASSVGASATNDQSDGLLINVDDLAVDWEAAAKAALTNGKVLVLESGDATNGKTKIAQASMKLVGISMEAMAIMLYQAKAEDSNSVLLMPFQANELQDLSKLMNMVGKRTNRPSETAVPTSSS